MSAGHPCLLQLHFEQSRKLVPHILGRTPPISAHLAPKLQGQVSATRRDDWSSLKRVDVLLQQGALSRLVDQTCFDLLNNAPNVRSKALARSSAIHHAGNWLHVES